ncbi:MAG: S8/S53 family peptidase [Candidatus Spechtbacterales bacterium]
MFNKKYTLLIIVFAFAILTASVVYAQDIRFDLENLREQDPLLVRAYDIVKVQDAWEEILDSGESLSNTTVNIGILDTGFESSHLEFDRVVIDTDSFVDHKTGGHGTQVLGIIGANNNAPNIKDNREMNGIIPGATDNYKITSRYAIDNSDFDYMFELERGLEQGMEIVNISGGLTKCSFKILFIKEPINCISDEDFNEGKSYFQGVFANFPQVLFVMSAGNEGVDASNHIPGGAVYTDSRIIEANNLITVGATDLKDERAKWFLGLLGSSNFGATVNISAPGKHVYAPKPGNDYDKPSELLGITFGGFSGTSASAPFVTGVAGLLKAINPDLSPAEIKQILIETGDPISTDQPIGPRLNAHSAVCHQEALNCSPTIFEDSFEDYLVGDLHGQGGWESSSGPGPLKWQVVDTGCIDGNKCVFVPRSLASAKRLESPVESGHIEYWAKMLGDLRLTFRLSQDIGKFGVSPYCEAILDGGNNRIIGNTRGANPVGDVEMPGGETLIRDHWYRISIEWDKDLQACRFRLDDNPWSAYNSTNLVDPFEALDTVLLMANISGEDNMGYIDFISKDSSSPSPASPPFPQEIISQTQYMQNLTVSNFTGSRTQTFILPDDIHFIDRVILKLSRTALSTGNFSVAIMDENNNILQSRFFRSSLIAVDVFEDVTLAFPELTELTPNMQYKLSIRPEGFASIRVAYSDQDPYNEGIFANNPDWDLYFRMFGF